MLTDNISISKIDPETPNPAIWSSPYMYLLRDGKVAGTVEAISISPFVGEHYHGIVVRECKKILKKATDLHFDIYTRSKIINVLYSSVTGLPIAGFVGPMDPVYADTRIVDQYCFDAGLAHPEFSKYEGYGWGYTRTRPKPNREIVAQYVKAKAAVDKSAGLPGAGVLGEYITAVYNFRLLLRRLDTVTIDRQNLYREIPHDFDLDSIA